MTNTMFPDIINCDYFLINLCRQIIYAEIKSLFHSLRIFTNARCNKLLAD